MCHQQFCETGMERWAHFGHNADKEIGIRNRKMCVTEGTTKWTVFEEVGEDTSNSGDDIIINSST
jgi:hypothetical protein